MKKKIVAVAVAGIVSVFMGGSTAQALDIALGSDYLHTLPGTWFNFGPGIGIVDLEGNPDLGLGNADTIVERQQDAVGLTPGDGGISSATIDIEMVHLSLQSIDPVFVTGPNMFFDVFIVLDQGWGADGMPGGGDDVAILSSTGSMTIRHELLDNGTVAAEGTFDSALTVYADAMFFVPGGGPLAFTVDIDNLLLESSNVPWSHEVPTPPVLMVPGPLGDQSANLHDGLPNGSLNDFFPVGFGGGIGWFEEAHPTQGVHVATLATIPEPGTMLLLGVGLLSVSTAARRRLTKKDR